MTKDQERLLNQAADAKLIHLNDGVIFPLLKKRIDMEIADMCASFRTTGEANIASVAYIAACRDIMQELENKARHGDKAAETLGHNQIT